MKYCDRAFFAVRLEVNRLPEVMKAILGQFPHLESDLKLGHLNASSEDIYLAWVVLNK